jgi:hypothetical protein
VNLRRDHFLWELNDNVSVVLLKNNVSVMLGCRVFLYLTPLVFLQQTQSHNNLFYYVVVIS